MTIYRLKAEKWYAHELWDCVIEITVDNKGKIVKIEEMKE